MDPKALTEHLAQEYARLHTALAAAEPTATVPSCPDWSVRDLEDHVAHVYLHKAECLRLGAFPQPWPPTEGVGSLERAYSALQAELAARQPEDPAVTWFDPDQSVGFWIRRMAQETVIHRVDAELALGGTITPIEPDLAVDGIDEVLKTFVAFASASWPEDFAEVLPDADRRPVLIAAGDRAWTVAAMPDRIVIADADPGDRDPGDRDPGDRDPGDRAAATVTGDPGAVYRWLWNRGGDVSINGDEALAGQLRAVLRPALQ